VRNTNTWAVATPSVTAALPQAIPRDSPCVLIVAGRESGTLIPVTSEPFVFGRAEEAPGKLGGDPELSRRHASVSVLDPGRLVLEDLSSTNGTFVNGNRIAAPTIVRPGDSVRLGTTTLEIVSADGAET
jgi:pSer/pThr/pTyr-binding forkhead associated (FHA) protein